MCLNSVYTRDSKAILGWFMGPIFETRRFWSKVSTREPQIIHSLSHVSRSAPDSTIFLIFALRRISTYGCTYVLARFYIELKARIFWHEHKLTEASFIFLDHWSNSRRDRKRHISDKEHQLTRAHFIRKLAHLAILIDRPPTRISTFFHPPIFALLFSWNQAKRSLEEVR